MHGDRRRQSQWWDYVFDQPQVDRARILHLDGDELLITNDLEVQRSQPNFVLDCLLHNVGRVR